MPNYNFIPLEKIKIKMEKRKQKQNNTSSVAVVNAPPNNTTAASNQIVSLEKYVNFVYDQGELGSCTANSFCAAFRICCSVQKRYPGFIPSRLFFYYNERLLEGTTSTDEGADIIDGESFVIKNGICSETLWPYDTKKFSVQPPQTCYDQALHYCITSYSMWTNLHFGADLVNVMKSQLIANNPLLISIVVYSSFTSDSVTKTGFIPIPNTNTETNLGGHEMCIIGYDDTKKCFLTLNSWGLNWGIRGKCYLPYTYIMNPNLCFEVSSISIF
jgi:C1A family cysteine protease